MADTKPLKIASGRTQQFAAGDTVPIANGGTGATTEADARTNLAVAGTGVSNTFTQPQTIQATSDAATLGAELVTNGTFTGSETGWTLGTNWEYGSDNVIVTLGAGAIGTLTQTQTLTVVSGTAYLIEWSQTNSVANCGTVRPSLGGADGIYVSPTSTSVGTMSQVVVATTSAPVSLTFAVTDASASGNPTITIDNVTVKAITPIAATLILKDTGAATQVEMRVANSSNDGNVALGLNALQSNTTGYYNTAAGTDALRSNTTGNNNTAAGVNALYANTTGYQNTAAGVGALRSNTTGNYNTAAGVNALRFNTTGANNTAAGVNALYANTTGFQNTATGSAALYSNTAGRYNTAAGMVALYSNTTGYYNTATGMQAIFDVTTGASNVGIGYNTGRGITTGSYNTILGANVTGLASDLTNNVILATGQGTIRGQFDGTNWTFQGAVLVGDGSAAAPSIANSDHTGTGISFPAANTLAVSTGGVERVRVDSVGHAVFQTVWKDLIAPLSAAGVPNNNAPTSSDFTVGGITRKEYAFAVNDYLYVQPFHVNHDIKPNGQALIHCHWTTNNTSTATVKWQFDIIRAKGHNQQAFFAETSRTIEQAASGTAYQHMVAEIAISDVLTLTEPDELLLVTVKRITNGGTDNSDTVFGLTVDIHYEAQYYGTINRAPNFYT